jgi:S-(hydroxymethyl)glutathione dehydrogenase/alcohol dehydrogenase
LLGTAFGGIKSKSELPALVDQYMKGKIDVDCFITHTMKLEDINKGFQLLEEGKSLRTVILF